MLAIPAGGTRMSAKIDYEIAEYDVFATKAQTLLDLGLTHTAKIFETLADLCYEKATMIVKVEEIYAAALRSRKKSGA